MYGVTCEAEGKIIKDAVVVICDEIFIEGASLETSKGTVSL